MAVSTLDEVKAGVWSVGEWQDRFTSGLGCWSPADVESRFVECSDKMFCGREKLRIYFPCCGNSADMKWVYDKGHEVIGTDCVDGALKDFFDRFKIPFTESGIESIDGTLYQSEDKRIRLYGCDVLKFTSDVEGPCDAMYDSAAITSINDVDLQRYCDNLKTMMTPDCRLLLLTLEYDITKYPGPPHSIPMEKIKLLFGDSFTYEHLLTYDMQQEEAEGEDRHHDDEGHHHGDESETHVYDGDKATTNKEKAAKDTILNQMFELEHMWAHYHVITHSKS